MSLRDKVKELSGKRTFDDGYVCPVLGPVSIRSLTEAEFQECLFWSVKEDWSRDRDRRKLENAKYLQMTLVDADRNLVFADTMEDILALAGLSKPVFTPLYDRAFAWNNPPTEKN